MNNSNMINFGYFPFISAGFLRGKKKKKKKECLNAYGKDQQKKPAIPVLSVSLETIAA